MEQQAERIIPRKPPVAEEERIWTCQEIAERYQLNVTTVRKMFNQEEGVIDWGRGGKNKHLRVPDSVLSRVLRRRMVRNGH